MQAEIPAFGTSFSPLDTAGALAAILARPPGAPFAYVCTPNAVHVVNYDRGEPRFRAGIDGAWLRLCDSRVVARIAALALGVRLPLALGSDLTQAMVQHGVTPEDTVSVIGGTAEMERRLRERHGWRCVARHDPPSRANGLRVWPPTALQPEMDALERIFAHSDKFVLPRMTASAARRCVTSGASRWVTLLSRAMLPAVVGRGPSASMLSLSRIAYP